MLPILRYAKVFLRLGRRPRVRIEGDSTITFRVWPNDQFAGSGTDLRPVAPVR